jgi:hypothetical protein
VKKYRRFTIYAYTEEKIDYVEIVGYHEIWTADEFKKIHTNDNLSILYYIFFEFI